jgi:plastocyanin
VVAIALLALLVVALVGAAPTVFRLLSNPAAGDPAVGSDAITVQNDAFDPPAIQIEPGTTVTWTFNDGDRAHNVVAESWSSEVLASGSYRNTFTAPGSYAYRCTLHWGMDGRVDVAATR